MIIITNLRLETLCDITIQLKYWQILRYIINSNILLGDSLNFNTMMLTFKMINLQIYLRISFALQKKYDNVFAQKRAK